MSDFIAHVIAELDTAKAQQQMNAFTNAKHKIDVDVNLVSKNGNINGYLNQIKSQFGQAGNAAGNNFANALNTTKHQGNVMSSLMNNFDIARQALEVSMNSEGSAMEEHEKWMESIEAKVNQLKAAWEGLSNSFLDSGFVKGAVSGLTGLVQIIDALINKIGVVPTLLTGVGIAAFVKNLS